MISKLGPFCIVLGGIIGIVSAIAEVTTWNAIWFIPLGISFVLLNGGGVLVWLQAGEVE